MEPEAPEKKSFGVMECVWFGIGTCFALSIAANGALFPSIQASPSSNSSQPWMPPNSNLVLLKSVYISLWLSLVVGAAIGREAYRQFGGTNSVSGESAPTMLASLVAFPFMVLPLLWIDLWTEPHKSRGTRMGGAFVLAALLLITLFECSSSTVGNSEGTLLALQICAEFVACMITAWITLALVGDWSRTGKLARPEPDYFRFSLRTLLIVVFLLGGFVSGLVLLSGP